MFVDGWKFVCPHCREVAPSTGDERYTWLKAHIDNVLHRWWWSFKRFRNKRSIPTPKFKVER